MIDGIHILAVIIIKELGMARILRPTTSFVGNAFAPFRIIPQKKNLVLALAGLCLFWAWSPVMVEAQTNVDVGSGQTVSSTVGSGRTDNNGVVNVRDGGQIVTSGNGPNLSNAISLGNNAVINIEKGGLVQNNASTGGKYNTGPNTIEVNSNANITINGTLKGLGTATNGEAINLHGVNNTVTVGTDGYVYSAHGAAIWFQDEISTGTPNTVINNGTIETGVRNGNVIGTSRGNGIHFTNGSTGRVIGNLLFSGGDDQLTFVARTDGNSGQASVSGSINGGGGTNSLVLQADDVSHGDILTQVVQNFSTIEKTGQGGWIISGELRNVNSVTVSEGVLGLMGNNTNFTGAITINSGATLDARAQALPNQATSVVTNNGSLNLDEPEGISSEYIGKVTGTGEVNIVGGGSVFMNPSAAGGNDYSGGTNIEYGTLAIADTSALGSGPLSMGGDDVGNIPGTNGTLELRDDLDLTSLGTVTLKDGGGTVNTLDNQVAMNQVVTGTGQLTKTGDGELTLGATTPIPAAPGSKRAP